MRYGRTQARHRTGCVDTNCLFMSKSFILHASLLLLVLVAVLSGIWLLYNHYYVRRKFHRLADSKYDVLNPVMQKIASNKTIKDSEVLSLVQNASLRYLVYLMLCEHNRQDLFPAEYYTHEKGAESFLANWLEFPTELGMAPDEIQLVKSVAIDDMTYYVFKYRTMPPHWAAANNWMLGVSGPYLAETLPYDIPLRVFSRFNTLNHISPEDEVNWVHKHIHLNARRFTL